MAYENRYNIAIKNYGNPPTELEPTDNIPEDELYTDDPETVDPELDDFFIGGDDPPVTDGGGGTPHTVEALRSRVNELKAMLKDYKGTNPSRSELKATLNTLTSALLTVTALRGEAKQSKLAEIGDTLAGVENAINGIDIDDPNNNGDGLKAELEAMKERIEDDDKIPSDIKRELKGEVDKLIAKSDVDLSDVKEENIREKMAEIEGKIEEARSITDGAKNLEEVTGKTAQEIQKIAESKGIDLNNLPKPPTAEVMEFLSELIPDLKAALQTAKDAVAAKKKTDDDMVTAAAAKSRANAASTTDVDQDRQGMAEFFYLLHAQTHTDESSKKMADAYSKFTTLLADKLKLLYPDVSISAVGNSFDDADLINFDNQKIDVLSNTEGTIISNTSLTGDPELALPQMVTLEYDWEGNGDYEDDPISDISLSQLQRAGYPTHAYD